MKTTTPNYVWRALLGSFLCQIAAIGLLGTYRFRTTDQHFAFGWEMGAIARSIALGHGFRDPYGVPTGPSAWEPPLYPYLIAGVFKIFGIYSAASAWVLEIINSLFASLTVLPIYWIARRCFDEEVARWSTWTWALLPYVWYWSIHWIWDTTISPFLLALIFLLTLELEDGPGSGAWLLYGVLWGLAVLLNPSLVAFLPFALVWAWHRCQKRLGRAGQGVLLGLLLCATVTAPWLVRNRLVFGQWVFIRDDFGQQFRLGNGPYADGWSMVYLQPNLNVHELDRFGRMGELAYARERQKEAFEFIRQNPGRTFIIDLKKFVYYWAGVPKPDDNRMLAFLRTCFYLASSLFAVGGLVRAVRKKQPAAWLFVWLILSYPTVYYVVYPHARYRHPIEPELLILALYLVREAKLEQAGRQALTSETIQQESYSAPESAPS